MRGQGLVWALLGLGACKQGDEAAKPVAYQGPMMETERVVTLLSDSARPQVQLRAPLEQLFESGDRLYPKGANVTFYDKPGRAVVNTLVAKWARYEAAKQLYIMRGAVRVDNVPQQQQLTTEELFYSRQQQRIYTDSAMYVRVQTPAEVLTGYGLTAAQDFSRYSIQRPTGTFSLEQARQLGK